MSPESPNPLQPLMNHQGRDRTDAMTFLRPYYEFIPMFSALVSFEDHNRGAAQESPNKNPISIFVDYLADDLKLEPSLNPGDARNYGMWTYSQVFLEMATGYSGFNRRETNGSIVAARTLDEHSGDPQQPDVLSLLGALVTTTDQPTADPSTAPCRFTFTFRTTRQRFSLPALSNFPPEPALQSITGLVTPEVSSDGARLVTDIREATDGAYASLLAISGQPHASPDTINLNRLTEEVLAFFFTRAPGQRVPRNPQEQLQGVLFTEFRHSAVVLGF